MAGKKPDPSDEILTLRVDVFTHAQQAYDAGYHIEAVNILHSATELVMNALLHLYYGKLVKIGNPKYFKYSVILEILTTLALVSSKELGELRKFNTKRNLLAHDFFSGKVKQKDAKEGFKLGKKVLLMLSQKGNKLSTSTELKEIEKDISSKLTALLSSMGNS